MTSSKSEFDKIFVNFSMLATPFKLMMGGRGKGDNMLQSSIRILFLLCEHWGKFGAMTINIMTLSITTISITT
jgi:hypothetical protein